MYSFVPGFLFICYISFLSLYFFDLLTRNQLKYRWIIVNYDYLRDSKSEMLLWFECDIAACKRKHLWVSLLTPQGNSASYLI